MKRKIIKLGAATLVASLPSKWTREFNLKQGDEIEVEENGNELILSTLKKELNERKEIDISGLDSNLVKRSLVSAYTTGYNEIVIRFSNSSIQRLKENKTISVLEFIQSIINKQLIGLEIIEQKQNYVVLKDLSGTSEQEFDVTLRRIFLLINSMSSEFLIALKSFDKVLINNTSLANDTIARFINYCLRILNKQGHKNFQKVPIYFYLLKKLKEIAYVYTFTSQEILNRKTKPSKEAIEACEDITNSINLFYELFYKYSNEKAVQFIKKTRDYYIRINPLQYSGKFKMEDQILICRLTLINIILVDLVEAKYGLTEN